MCLEKQKGPASPERELALRLVHVSVIVPTDAMSAYSTQEMPKTPGAQMQAIRSLLHVPGIHWDTTKVYPTRDRVGSSCGSNLSAAPVPEHGHGLDLPHVVVVPGIPVKYDIQL